MDINNVCVKLTSNRSTHYLVFMEENWRLNANGI